MRVKGLFLNVFTVVLGCMVGYVLCEIALRVHYSLTYGPSFEEIASHVNPPAGSEVRLGDMFRPSSNGRIVYTLKPNLDVLFKRFYDDPPNNISRVMTNSHGWREKEFSEAKAASTIRILGLGDSYMFGWGVPVEDRYMDKVRDMLARAYPEFNWETITLAAPGYNLVQLDEIFRVEGRKLNPDLVVYNFIGNDQCLPNFLYPRENVYSFKSFLGIYLKKLIKKQNEASDLFERLPDERFLSQVCDEREVPSAYSDLAGWEPFYRAFDHLAQQLSERLIPGYVLFVDAPGFLKYIPGYYEQIYFEAEKQRYLKEHGGIPLDESALVFEKRDIHPSIKGHALIAKALFDGLRASRTFQDIINKKRMTLVQRQ